MITWKKSIPQTRLRLQKIMIGLEAESGEEEWENETEGGGEKGKTGDRAREKKMRRRSDGGLRRMAAKID